MEHQFTIFSLIFLGTSLISIFVAFLAWQRRKVRGAIELSRLTLSAGAWAFVAMFESAAVTVGDKVFMSQVAYIFATTTPVMYLLFVLRYVGIDRWMPLKYVFWLFLVPLITLVAAFTNEYHHYIWTGFSEISPATNLMEYHHGIWFWIGYFGYNYILQFVATFLLFAFIFKQTYTYRRQGWVIVLAGLCPWAASVLYVSGSNPTPGLDIVPMSVVLSAMLFFYGILYFKFLDLAPIAREALVEELSDGILALDSQGRIQEINPAAIRYLGIETSKARGMEISSLQVADAILQQAILSKEQGSSEIKSGIGRQVFSVFKKAIEAVPGSKLVVIRDITEMVERENEILRKDKLLDAISTASARLIQGTNLESSVQEAMALIGKAAGVNRVYIFRNEHDEAYRLPLMSQIYEWTDGSVDAQIDNPDLQKVPYEIACPRWFEQLSQGNVIVGNIRDFPGNERESLETQGILSILVTPIFIDALFWGFLGFDDCKAERNWPVTDEQILKTAANTIGSILLREKNQLELLNAKLRAEESDRLKSAFLTNMSHEIRTPMNGILGFISLLEEPDLTSQEKDEYVRIVRQSGERLLNTLRDIIDISKIESGMMPVTFSVFSVDEVLANLYDFYNTEAQSKGLKLFLRASDSTQPLKLMTDRVKFNSILSNLLKNAIKFTSKGYVEFGYTTRDQMLEFFVRDTGIGIPEEKIVMIFDRFIQADDSNTRLFEGAGLGLSICRAYTMMLGGKLWVETEKDRGSIFRFTIPLETISSVQKEVQGGEIRNAGQPGSKLKILVTEDDPVNLEYIQVILSRAGHTVVPAVTGAEAIAALRSDTAINFVLMDIKLPGMDGLEATREIRKWNQTIPVVALTANAFAHDRQSALDAGCNEYLTKPVRKSELLKCIDNLSLPGHHN